jgi:preprotein translocase subunit SecE
MSGSSVETVSSGLERLRLVLVAVLVVASVVGFYFLSRHGLWVQLLVLFGGLAAAVVTFLTSELGREFVAYARDSVKEVRKVVWPTRQEAGQMTLYVFAFVVVMAIFLWGADKTLEWVLFDLVLGWRR